MGGDHACLVSLKGHLANNRKSSRKRINPDSGPYHRAGYPGEDSAVEDQLGARLDMQGRMVLEVTLDHGLPHHGVSMSMAMKVCWHYMYLVVNCSPENK